MTNSVVRNPILIDTWSADIVISTTAICVKKIRLLSAAAGDLFYLRDGSGTNQVCLLVTKTNAHATEIDFGKKGFTFDDGLYVTVADCTGLASGDKAWIYLK